VPFVSPDHPVLVTAARHGLPIEPLSREAPVLVGGGELEALRLFCRTDRISGLLASAVQAGEIVIAPGSETGHQIELIDDDWHEALHACVLVEALLVRVAARLDDIGTRWLVTKGPAVAHLDFPDTAVRTFADVDLVIHPDDWDAVLGLFEVDRVGRSRALDFVKRYGKGWTVMVDDMEVDLHLRFAIGSFGARCRMAECFERTDTFVLADRRVPALVAEYRLLHACYHACLGGNAELRAFRDVAQLAVCSPAAAERTWAIARAWGVEAVVAAAVREAWRRLRLPMDHPAVVAAQRVATSRADRAAIAVFARHDRFRRQSLTTLAVLPVRDRPRFVYTAWKMSREHRR
jgi:hypothetical protein